MIAHVLDRPVWQTMNGYHAALAHGGERAKRFAPEVSAFAATGDDSPESLAALADLVAPGEIVVMVQAEEIKVPAGMQEVDRGSLVQLTSAQMPEPRESDDITELGPDDAADMLALADLTKPGPLTIHALMLGRFWGIRRDGQLVAMAGQRMRVPGYSEISGICTHSDFQGQGLARRLSIHVMRESMAGGDTAFLHAHAHNDVAVGLYQSLGFSVRTGMQMMRLQKIPDEAIMV